MYKPPKLIYSPSQLYKSDINDLVEEDMQKGGPGSGIKGHKTAKKESTAAHRSHEDHPELPGFKHIGMKDHGTGYVTHEYEYEHGGQHSKLDSEEYQHKIHEMGKEHWPNRPTTGKMFESRLGGSSVGWDTGKKKHTASFTVKK